MLQMNGALAQEAPAGPAAAVDGLNMERVVVTGTTAGASKMKSSVSVSTMEHDAILQAAFPACVRSPRAAKAMPI